MIISCREVSHNTDYKIIGKKAKHLLEMYALNIPVPNFVIIPINPILTIDDNLVQDIISEMELLSGKKYGDINNPLVLSVRSSCEISMPGIMNTIVNVGLSKEIISAIENKKFAKDLLSRNYTMDIEQSIIEVKDSFFSDKAIEYRKLYNISESVGIAVIVQEMVFGNMNYDSATGVVFSRNPDDGRKGVYGEYLLYSQGDDIVSGVNTPDTIYGLQNCVHRIISGIYEELLKYCELLERHYKNIQDIEFTIENKKLWILQTRSALLSPQSVIPIALSLYNDGFIDKAELINRIDYSIIENSMYSKISDYGSIGIVAMGISASPGAVSGRLSIKESATVDANDIIVRDSINTDDIVALSKCAGLITKYGGMTSHAAIVARGMGKPCITGIYNMIINDDHIIFDDDQVADNMIRELGYNVVQEGDNITIDSLCGGFCGSVFTGIADIKKASNLSDDILKFIDIIKQDSKIKVFANADNVDDLKTAIGFGADGIGLCRTEHMFFEEKRSQAIQRYIIHKDNIDDIYNFQKEDFYKMFKYIKTINYKSSDFPIVIRLMDPPLHEFLPKDLQKASSLHEINPMLGNRGCRLAITDQQLYLTQVKAISDAAYLIGIRENIKILIPFVSFVEEILYIKELIKDYSKGFMIGTMIETPRSILIADKIAKNVDFLSFGTNDLTQMTLGLSRDDSTLFMQKYLDSSILQNDPFVVLDETVYDLMQQCILLVKQVNPNICISICGEHAGNVQNYALLKELKPDYISCSPYKIPASIIGLNK